jgi:hypothetical protein
MSWQARVQPDYRRRPAPVCAGFAGSCQPRQPTHMAEVGHVLPRSAEPCRATPDVYATFVSRPAGSCRVRSASGTGTCCRSLPGLACPGTALPGDLASAHIARERRCPEGSDGIRLIRGRVRLGPRWAKGTSIPGGRGRVPKEGRKRLTGPKCRAGKDYGRVVSEPLGHPPRRARSAC